MFGMCLLNFITNFVYAACMLMYIQNVLFFLIIYIYLSLPGTVTGRHLPVCNNIEIAYGKAVLCDSGCNLSLNICTLRLVIKLLALSIWHAVNKSNQPVWNGEVVNQSVILYNNAALKNTYRGVRILLPGKLK